MRLPPRPSEQSLAQPFATIPGARSHLRTRICHDYPRSLQVCTILSNHPLTASTTKDRDTNTLPLFGLVLLYAFKRSKSFPGWSENLGKERSELKFRTMPLWATSATQLRRTSGFPSLSNQSPMISASCVSLCYAAPHCHEHCKRFYESGDMCLCG
jgi:hypothetical protein